MVAEVNGTNGTSKFKEFFRQLVSAPVVKRSSRSALFCFVSIFSAALLGWLADVSNWASDGNAVLEFPDPSVLVKAAASAAAAAVTLFVAALVNAFENTFGVALFHAKTDKLD